VERGWFGARAKTAPATGRWYTAGASGQSREENFPVIRHRSLRRNQLLDNTDVDQSVSTARIPRSQVLAW